MNRVCRECRNRPSAVAAGISGKAGTHLVDQPHTRDGKIFLPPRGRRRQLLESARGIVAKVCLWRGTVPGPSPTALRERASSEDCCASTHGGLQILSARKQIWLLLAIFAAAALVRVGLVERHSLWADEVFSLAIATGHSLEHPAATADPALGDFVEPEGPVYAEEFKRYLAHENPPASPARVVRAVFLSDTNPPLYYLLLYGWTLVTGTSDAALRLFSTAWSLACLPLLAGVARRTGGGRAVLPSCILFALSPLAVYYSAEGRM